MKVHSDRPYWFLRNGLKQSYPSLRRKVESDIVVIGAGITGALIADRLVSQGLRVTILDSRDVGCGSTSASTALLQYELDIMLWDLRQLYGPIADKIYQSGVDACHKLEQLSRELGESVGFQKRNSCYLANDESDVEQLRREFESRRNAGLPVEYWNAQKLQEKFDFPAAAALWSTVGAQVDPYALTHALLRRIVRHGGQIYDRSDVVDFQLQPQGLTFITEHGSASCRHGVIAAGYESQVFLPQPVAKLNSTFAFVTEPIEDFPGWPEQCLIWETKRPYLYLRTTSDGRMLAGGADVPFRKENLRDAMLPTRAKQIEERVRSMFPRIPFVVDYQWAGTFGETADSLPYIGKHPERRGLLFALCYGGNGIAFSVLAADILQAIVKGDSHPLAEAVGFDRKASG